MKKLLRIAATLGFIAPILAWGQTYPAPTYSSAQINSTINLGIVGSAAGQATFANATSGTVSLAPPTGALGSAILTLPDATDTLADLAGTQTFTNKTISGSSNTITNVSLSTGVSGSLPYANLSSLSANTVLGALSATTPSGLSVPSCSTASSALTWTSGTGFGCNTITTGSGTVNSGTAGQFAYYNASTNAVSSNSTLQTFNGTGTNGIEINYSGTNVPALYFAGTSGNGLTVQSPSLSANGILTLPNTTDTLAGIAAAQTLTNKTISGASNTISNVSLTTGVVGTLPVGNGGTGATTFGAAMTTWFNSLPTSLPGTSGVLWNDGGTLAKS